MDKRGLQVQQSSTTSDESDQLKQLHRMPDVKPPTDAAIFYGRTVGYRPIWDRVLTIACLGLHLLFSTKMSRPNFSCYIYVPDGYEDQKIHGTSRVHNRIHCNCGFMAIYKFELTSIGLCVRAPCVSHGSTTKGCCDYRSESDSKPRISITARPQAT